jgi:hypothetical protein
MAVTINGTTGIAGVDGSASTPAVQGTDTNTGIFFPAADTIAFGEGGAESMRIDSSGNVGIGTSSPSQKLDVTGNARLNASSSPVLQLSESGTLRGSITGSSTIGLYFQTFSSTPISFDTNGLERARITSGGDLLVNKTAANTNTVGLQFIVADNKLAVGSSDNASAFFNRNTTDGQIVQLAQDGTVEGTISVSGTTVSYNGGHLSRWAQMPGTKDDTLVKGTVMSNLDEMNVYTKEGNPVDNEQLNKVKVSDVDGDVNVAGVFVNWTYDEDHQVDEINMAMTGDMIIRIAQGVVVQKGDLLMSAGDGTAKPQDDDIVRSKTVAKVTSNHVTCTYADGSYCVPCVLMAC